MKIDEVTGTVKVEAGKITEIYLRDGQREFSSPRVNKLLALRELIDVAIADLEKQREYLPSDAVEIEKRIVGE